MSGTAPLTGETVKHKKKKNSRFITTAKRVFRNKGAVVGLVVITVIILLAILAPVIAPYGYAEMNIPKMFTRPNSEHWLGTDHVGRDILSRILYGGRFSLQIGFYATVIAIVFGVTIGAIAGYFGGLADNIIMRFVDILQAIPGMLLSIAVTTVLGAGLWEMSVALAIGNISTYCRILRGSVLTIRKSEFIDAAIADSTSHHRIIFSHIIPNAISPIIVQATLGAANIILLASSLSFIGMGIAPPNPEWGAMLSEGRSYIRDYSYLLISPGMAIALTVLSLNLLGDGLRDALDPKQKR